MPCPKRNGGAGAWRDAFSLTSLKEAGVVVTGVLAAQAELRLAN